METELLREILDYFQKESKNAIILQDRKRIDNIIVFQELFMEFLEKKEMMLKREHNSLKSINNKS